MTELEKQLLRACLSASTFLQGLKPGNFTKEMVLDELTLAIQATNKKKCPVCKSDLCVLCGECDRNYHPEVSQECTEPSCECTHCSECGEPLEVNDHA